MKQTRPFSLVARALRNGASFEVSPPTIEQAMNAAYPDDSDLHLRALVHRHHITWESRPELADCDGELTPIGFTVELSAVDDHPEHPPSPGCSECAPVREALHRICLAVLPRGEHASWYDVHVGSALESDPRHGGRPELSATIEILHRGTVNRPSDECERACLAEIKTRLAQLGAQHEQWVEARATD
jgi:hypothetical protein